MARNRRTSQAFKTSLSTPEETMCPHYNMKPLKWFMEITAAHRESRTKSYLH